MSFEIRSGWFWKLFCKYLLWTGRGSTRIIPWIHNKQMHIAMYYFKDPAHARVMAQGSFTREDMQDHINKCQMVLDQHETFIS